jgi:hypothetical protein
MVSQLNLSNTTTRNDSWNERLDIDLSWCTPSASVVEFSLIAQEAALTMEYYFR